MSPRHPLPLKTRGKAPQSSSATPASIERFSSLENDAWYTTHENNPLVVEHTLASKLGHELQVFRKLNTLDWGPVINLSGVFYPCLVQEFYANIAAKEADPCTPISSFVKGVEITVSRDTIAIALNILDRGPTFDMCRDHVLSRMNIMPRIRKESEVRILFQHGVSFDGEEKVHTTNGRIINEVKLASMGFSCDHERNWRRKKEDSIDDEEEKEEAIAERGPFASHEVGQSRSRHSSTATLLLQEIMATLKGIEQTQQILLTRQQEMSKRLDAQDKKLQQLWEALPSDASES
ncbi:hypothetical protein M9H77_23784 [Catharanthus roseus]|uniref:Uncharacterized protein n=1 Tax=Catharanthus roseus TaxID=4058 RepID=A0ACC0AV20_CATRO|nr:hypothetical protein M9H77_23784 [Catharanthus roseus]